MLLHGLLAFNAVLLVTAWLAKNEWTHQYLRRALLAAWNATPWHQTNTLLSQLLKEVKTQAGTPLKDALEHLDVSIQHMAGTLAIMSVRQRMYDRILGNAVITADAKGKVLWVSETMLELVGAQSSDLLGDNWINYVYQDDRELVLEEWNRAVEAGRDFALCYRHYNPVKRETICTEARAYAAKISPHVPPAGWVAFVKEISHEKCRVGQMIPHG